MSYTPDGTQPHINCFGTGLDGSDVTGLSVDDSAGTDIVLNADTTHIDLLTPGLYYVQVFVNQDPGAVSALTGDTDSNDGGGANRMVKVSTAAHVRIKLTSDGITAGAPSAGAGITVFKVA